MTIPKYIVKYSKLQTHFLKNWKPKIAVFVDSEIWPNMFKKLEANGTPIILINGRITKKSFEKQSY